MEKENKINNKKWIVIIIILITLVSAISLFFILDKNNLFKKEEISQTDRCFLDISSLILKDEENNLKTKEDVGKAMFEHYFNEYTKIKDCPESALKSYKLVSIGEITESEDFADNFLIPIVFDLEPVSMEKTQWLNEGEIVENGWIKNKKGVLSIRKSENGYYLVI